MGQTGMCYDRWLSDLTGKNIGLMKRMQDKVTEVN